MPTILRSVNPYATDALLAHARLEWDTPEVINQSQMDACLDVSYPEAAFVRNIEPHASLRLWTTGLTMCSATILGFLSEQNGARSFSMYLNHSPPTLAVTQACELEKTIKLTKLQDPSASLVLAGLVTCISESDEVRPLFEALSNVREEYSPDEVYAAQYTSYADLEFALVDQRFSVQLTY
jgi:hypothetical protein